MFSVKIKGAPGFGSPVRNSLRSRVAQLALVFFTACSDSPSPPAGDASVVRDAATNDRDASVADADAGGELALGSWTALRPLPRGPRQETAVVELGGSIYLIGGFDDQQRIVGTVEAYDPA